MQAKTVRSMSRVEMVVKNYANSHKREGFPLRMCEFRSDLIFNYLLGETDGL